MSSNWHIPLGTIFITYKTIDSFHPIYRKLKQHIESMFFFKILLLSTIEMHNRR